jgi:glycerol-3-phosphate dehydrogenase (NAD(P)+)
MATIGVVGAGAWGTALASHAARLGHPTRLWALEPEVAAGVNERHVNTVYLPDLELPAALAASNDVAAVVAPSDVVILVPPSQHVRRVAAMIAPHVKQDAIVLVASKGIEEDSLELLSTVLARALPSVGPHRLGFLSGPSFAREVARGLPTDVVVASHEMVAAQAVQPILHAPRFRVYASADPVGVQIGGAIKNVIAIAAGACDGLGLGANARAALTTRGLAEMARLGVALGADPLTFLGLAGVGDLILTCTGDLSRNRTLGMRLAEGTDPATYLASVRSVAEGYWTCAAAYGLAQRLGVETPIVEQVYHVLHEGRSLADALQRLLSREFKEELRGIVAPLRSGVPAAGDATPVASAG